MPKYRYWCWTWFDFDLEQDNPEFWKRFPKSLTYGIYQVEKCPKTGRIHWQGYCEFKNGVSAASIQSAMPKSNHSKRNKSGQEARDYCAKEESKLFGPFEFGVWVEDKPGKRNDLDKLKEDIALGLSGVGLWDANFGTMMKFHRGAEKYLLLKQAPRVEVTQWELHIGLPGTGKTTTVALENPGCFWKAAGDWWDMYAGEKTVAMDEFHGWLPYHVLLRLGDGTPLQVQVKGSTVQFTASKLVIISNKDPAMWYRYNELGLDFNALARRFKKICLHLRDRNPIVFNSYDEYSAHVLKEGYN